MVTGLTSPRGTRGTERGWGEKKGGVEKRGNQLKKKGTKWKKNTTTLIGRDRKRENVDGNLFKRPGTLKVNKGFAVPLHLIVEDFFYKITFSS